LHAVYGKESHPKEYHLKTDSSRLFKNHSTDPCEQYSLSPAGEDSLGFGRSFTVLDLNQDGSDDLVSGFPCAQGRSGKSRSGEISFFLARGHSRLIHASAAYQPEKIRLDEYFGFSLSRGDVNGDGRTDILVGAPGMPRTKGMSASGGAYVILGLSPK
jgi:hypothetical protein